VSLTESSHYPGTPNSQFTSVIHNTSVLVSYCLDLNDEFGPVIRSLAETLLKEEEWNRKFSIQYVSD